MSIARPVEKKLSTTKSSTMASPALARQAARPTSFVCHSCRRHALGSTAPRRAITQGFLRKTIEAEMDWSRQAMEVKEGKRKSVFEILEERGLVNQTAG
jgi:tyrosyl-tRNA synthetase